MPFALTVRTPPWVSPDYFKFSCAFAKVNSFNSICPCHNASTLGIPAARLRWKKYDNIVVAKSLTAHKLLMTFDAPTDKKAALSVKISSVNSEFPSAVSLFRCFAIGLLPGGAAAKLRQIQLFLHI